MRIRTTVAALLAVALVTGACSNGAEDPHAAEVAAEVLNRVDEEMGAREAVESGEVVVPEGCRLEIVTDEYGFEVEVVVCDDDPGTTTTTSSIPEGDLDAWLESRDARRFANALYAIVIQQEGCTNPDAIDDLRARASAAPAVVAGPVLDAAESLDRMVAACGTDIDAWQRALEDALDDLDTLAALLGEAPDA